MPGRGGRRRHHVPPALTAQQVAEVRKLRAEGMRYKHLMRIYPVSRDTLCNAVHGKDAYGLKTEKG